MENRNSTSRGRRRDLVPHKSSRGRRRDLVPLSSRGRHTDWRPRVTPALPPNWRPRVTPALPGSEIEKNESISIAAIEEEAEWIIDVHESLEPHPVECCIYRVPGPLRKVKQEAYTPKVISIGPLSYVGAISSYVGLCYDMTKQKIRYKRAFVNRITPEKWQQLMNFIQENEKKIRNSYDTKIELDKLRLISMILYDAVFIIELFLKYYKEESDCLLNRLCLREAISSDLRLLENQLPFFVLDGLYQLAFPNHGPQNGYPPFISLSCVFFRHCNRSDSIEVKAEEILHFTDLSRYFMTTSYPEKNPKQAKLQASGVQFNRIKGECFDIRFEKYPEQEERFKDLPCAAKLQASGVQFNRIKGDCLLDIKFEKKKWLGIPSVKVAKLQIPQIDVDDCTEILMRNVMALEQCHYPSEAVVCNYVDLMDKLIDTDEDVNLLAEAGIISNYLGDGTRMADMFNGLCLEIRFFESNYTGIIKDLRDHYDNRWNNAKATLKRVYFTNLWTGTGTVAAVVLLVLTLIQTICSVMSV
ncbi:hypothetical protein KPL70_018551 [Citrus sinensis]|uniref:putative UPF0481 protein At3g02645 isoform X1 n=1 Tax=Citrus sinensis TaxID=2711 RepID=UPI0007635A00|nr:putative UPF0481 protein At3g02645 [Citrus sinensis]XP_052299570.1 putative UPF0481 protein At3g02645 isoform X1 [Citrus sinensis]XP_052299571.1 putative UPF0481 protein At3g02645 isoform X1 [Citrus sinensis]XP_052299572.1 putative UPF0481 protein At3g02645 isoform X1 [Citrus sinensis]KAH9674632.1 hypothetical protein KPL70_018533 [Citrus sinensis]KAH9674664.1 hypothetical protein KPL70_018551 [Citrus sinensis]